MSTPSIKSRFLSDARADEAFKLKLAKANSVKMSTIDRWLKNNDESLTTFRNLELLKEYFGLLEVQELLENVFLETPIAAAS
jgi:hypothetical protein